MIEEVLSEKARAVLNEVYIALERLSNTGEGWTIFTNKMALTQEERQGIRDYLGQGTIRIQLEGSHEPAEWIESGVSGIWYGVFYDQAHNPILETLEVGFFPQVPSVQVEDLKLGLVELNKRLLET